MLAARSADACVRSWDSSRISRACSSGQSLSDSSGGRPLARVATSDSGGTVSSGMSCEGSFGGTSDLYPDRSDFNTSPVGHARFTVCPNWPTTRFSLATGELQLNGIHRRLLVTNFMGRNFRTHPEMKGEPPCKSVEHFPMQVWRPH